MLITSKNAATLVALVAVPLLIGLFAGCSASGGEPTSTTEGGTALTDQQKYEEWTLKINACMAPKGYDLPDPGANVGQGIEIDDQAAFEAAMKECTDEIGPGPGGTLDQKSSEALLESVIKLNACLRERGYDMKDPDPGSNSISLPDDIDPEDLQACQTETETETETETQTQTGGGGLSAR